VAEFRRPHWCLPGDPFAVRDGSSQAEFAGRLDVMHGAISKLEHSDNVRVSILRQYLDALGARLECVALFDDDDRRVSIHLVRDIAA
jgi:transcriptional regulator with XRE-family HTH domain